MWLIENSENNGQVLPIDSALGTHFTLHFFLYIVWSETHFFPNVVSKPRQTKVIAPHTSMTCYDIPETVFCTSLTFVLSLKYSDPVFCPIHNSTIGWSVFKSCISRLEGTVIPFIHTNGSVCLDSPYVNETTLHFQCSTEPCRDGTACFIKTVVASHKIVLAGIVNSH